MRTIPRWRLTATAVGVLALFLSGWIVRTIPGLDGIARLACFISVSIAIVAALTVWLVPRSRPSS